MVGVAYRLAVLARPADVRDDAGVEDRVQGRAVVAAALREAATRVLSVAGRAASSLTEAAVVGRVLGLRARAHRR